MYNYNRKVVKTQLRNAEKVEGITLERKIERMMKADEPLTADGSPLIFTEKKEGVIAAYDVRTDVWEVAAEAMDVIAANRAAKKDGVLAKVDDKKKSDDTPVVKLDPQKDGEAKSTQGNNE